MPYEGLYIEALRPQGAVQWSQVGSMGSKGWSLKVPHEGLKVLWGAG